jgi:glycosyltransferase involved in cell wall biosynthesis
VTSDASTILFSDWNPSRSNGGEELVLRQTLLGLSARGWRCLLAYHEWGDLIPEYEAAGIQCRQFNLTSVQLSSPSLFLKSVAGQVLWARRAGVRILHCNSYGRAAYAAAVKSLCRLPAVCHFHTEPPSYLSRQYRWGLRQLEGYITVSNWNALAWSQALDVSRERVTVVQNGIDVMRFRPNDDARKSARCELGVADDCVVIGYCGRIVREKGIDVLLHAFARLAGQYPAIKLVLLGSDAQNILHFSEPLVPKLKTLARELGIAERVLFLGVRHDVERWYNGMDVMVVPSPEFEPFGLVVAEALACGRPVIASRVGGLPEILNGSLAELLVPPNDAYALATALQRLVIDPQKRREIGNLGRQIVETKFSVQNFLDKLESALNGIAT